MPVSKSISIGVFTGVALDHIFRQNRYEKLTIIDGSSVLNFESGSFLAGDDDLDYSLRLGFEIEKKMSENKKIVFNFQYNLQRNRSLLTYNILKRDVYTDTDRTTLQFTNAENLLIMDNTSGIIMGLSYYFGKIKF